MLKIRSKSKLVPTLGCAVIAAQVAMATGCGAGVPIQPTSLGANAAVIDLPVCTPSMSLTPPAAAGGTPDPRMDPNRTGMRLDRYHLQDGASVRDRLFLAVIKDDKDGLAALLNAGVDANSSRGGGFSIANDGLLTFEDDSRVEHRSALQMAAAYSYQGATIQLLLSHGANVHSKDSKGRTPLMEAAQNEYLDASGVRALLAAGADVHERDRDGDDALMLAASSDNRRHDVLCLAQAKLQALQGAGADINENLRLTPIMAALYNRNLGLAKLIHALGGNLNLRAAFDGSTALHIVAKAANDDIETVNWLLSRGVNLHARDNAHRTALDVFKENLAQGRCYIGDSSRPDANRCKAGTQAIIDLLEKHHRR